MGSWSVTIMGGDEPMDVEDAFTDAFGESEVTPEMAIDFLSGKVGKLRGVDQETAEQVVGFLMIQRGARFNSNLRKIVLAGIDLDDATIWEDPTGRKQVMDDFRKIVEEYPDGGAKVDLPHQPGLFETIAGARSF